MLLLSPIRTPLDLYLGNKWEEPLRNAASIWAICSSRCGMSQVRFQRMAKSGAVVRFSVSACPRSCAISSSRCLSTLSCASKSDRRFWLRCASRALICFWPASFSSSVSAVVAARRASLIWRSSSLISRSRPTLRSSAQPSSFSASASKKRALRSEMSRWMAVCRCWVTASSSVRRRCGRWLFRYSARQGEQTRGDVLIQ